MFRDDFSMKMPLGRRLPCPKLLLWLLTSGESHVTMVLMKKSNGGVTILYHPYTLSGWPQWITQTIRLHTDLLLMVDCEYSIA